MKRSFLLTVLLLSFVASSPSFSADYQKGMDAYDKGDYSSALEEWAPLAEQGNAKARFMLGCMYRTGQGTPQDLQTSVKWTKLAADQGLSAAQYSLGKMYSDGHGVTQDFKLAIKWYKIASEQGHASAHYNLGIIYQIGQGVPGDINIAAKWYKLSAEQGLADGQYYLGELYGRGAGITKDTTRALMWWNIAASQGSKKAQKMLTRIEEEVKNLGSVEMETSHHQLKTAQRLADECVAKNYKGC